MKKATKFKRILSGVLSAIMTFSAVPIVSAHAEENAEPYPYTMFAASSDEGAITINANNVCVNGNIATNGTIVTTSPNFNINGTKTENANEEMLYIQKKLNYSYFSGENVETYTEDYVLEDLNININNPMNVNGTLEMTGNINMNSGIKALEDVNLNGEVKNTNNSVIFSETGDININTSNTNFSGLIYAPYGDIVIDSDNLNLNNVVIIGQTITLDCPSINANYSTYMAELVGTESDIDVELYAMGEYNSEANSIDIEWYTNYENSSYEIWISDDNEEYTSVGVVSDGTAYQYPITENLEKRYFKISLTTNYGEYIESVPFIVTKTEEGYSVNFLDSDDDGIPDVFEIMIGTDINVPDTDNDGLTDYQEVYITRTNPTKFDSVTEGVSDADADSDSDGLSNAQEINLGTDPQLSDTDGDNLSDYDEINVYGTDPLKPDTDDDGLEDGDEPYIGLDPANPETFGIPDAEYKVEQTISADSDVLAEINTAENAYELSIDIKTNGYAEKEVTVSKSSYSYAIENDAMIGASADISISNTCNPEEIVIKYNIKEAYIDNTLNLYSSLEEFQGIKRLNIFKFYEDKNMLLPIETEFDVENGLLYAEVDELGTYCIMDLEIWFNMLGIVPEIESEEQPYTLSDPEIQDNTFSIDNHTSFKKYFLKNKTYALYEKTGLSWEEAKRYCESLGGHLVTITSPEEQNFINNILSDSYNNLYWIGAKKVNNLWSWVTGEPFAYVNWAEDEPSSQTNENYVHIYAKSDSNGNNKGEWNNTLSFYDSSSSFYSTSNCGFICEWEDNPNIPQEYCILLPTNWKKITLVGELSPNNGIDTDNDSLTDWEEVDTTRLIWNEDGSFELPKFDLSEFVHILQRKDGVTYPFLRPEDFFISLSFLPILSDPTNKDSDGDGLLDGESQYYKGKKIAPQDPNRLKMNGPNNIWKIHIAQIKNGEKWATDYSNDYYKPEKPEAKVKFLFHIIPYLENNFLEVLLSSVSAISSDVLDFRYDEKHIALHSDTTQWQAIGGYNDFYDYIFNKATSMKRLKLAFCSDGQDYVVWAWKGNYLALGAGSEVGFYTKNNAIEEFTGLEHWMVDKEFPMTLSLYQNHVNGLYNWYPNLNQWWITGFVPNIYDYSVTADELIQVSSIDFSSSPNMLKSMKEEYKDSDYAKNLIFDEEDNILWLAW